MLRELASTSMRQLLLTWLGFLGNLEQAPIHHPKNGLNERRANDLVVQDVFRTKVKIDVPNPLSSGLSHPKAYKGQLWTFIFLR